MTAASNGRRLTNSNPSAYVAHASTSAPIDFNEFDISMMARGWSSTTSTAIPSNEGNFTVFWSVLTVSVGISNQNVDPMPGVE